MSHFAKVTNGVVEEVIVAEQDFINTLEDKDSWIQTSYNTHGGVHALGGTPLRKNYAFIGCTYDSNLDAFIPIKPYASWIFDPQTCLWSAPVAMPQDGKLYFWDESLLNWVEPHFELENK
jgi:hypothetical protein